MLHDPIAQMTAQMITLSKGRLTARMATSAQDLLASQSLRAAAFRPNHDQPSHDRPSADADAYDARCQHVLIVTDTGALLATFRLMVLADPSALSDCYAAQFYDLAPLASQSFPLMELGRFCLAPACDDPDALRLAWAMITAVVDLHGVSMLFGCSSFHGTDPAPYGAAFDHLAAHALGPVGLRPCALLPTVHLAPATHPPSRPTGLAQMPALLRSYLAMGGWVGADVVTDPDLGTLHVFTALPIAAIPPARAAALRALAKGA